MLVIERQQTVTVRGEAEEVGLLFGPSRRSTRLAGAHATVGRGLDLVLGEEALVLHGIPAGVGARIDVTRRRHRVPEGDGGLHVIRVGRADETVERDVQADLHRFERVRVATRQRRRRHALRGGRAGHLQSVLVGAGEEAHVETVEPLETRDRVRRAVLVRVADMRGAVGIGDGGRDVERCSVPGGGGSGHRPAA